MRMDWVPVSAALLLTGALALGAGAFLLPTSGDSAETLSIVQDQGGQWMAAAVVLFLSSVFLTLGLPAILTLFQRRGWGLAMISGILLEIGFVGTAGFAMLMVFFHSLVVADAIKDPRFDAAASEAGLATFIAIWLAGLYLGELLLAIALLRAGFTPRWVSVALILHVASFPVSGLLPEVVSQATILLLVLGFAGIAIQAASPEARRRLTR
ncbi:MAG: hypothetical protein WBP61_14730 [Nocardioides sp.]